MHAPCKTILNYCPLKVTITTINFYPTAVLLGFVDSNSSVILTEGGENQLVCVDIKSEGLPLDPFDYIPLTIRTESLGITLILYGYKLYLQTVCV